MHDVQRLREQCYCLLSMNCNLIDPVSVSSMTRELKSSDSFTKPGDYIT